MSYTDGKFVVYGISEGPSSSFVLVIQDFFSTIEGQTDETTSGTSQAKETTTVRTQGEDCSVRLCLKPLMAK